MKAPNVSIEQQIGALQRLDLEELRAVWRASFGEPPPLRSVDLLKLCLAWRLQAGAYGGLDRDVKRKLGRSGPLQAEGLELGIGARLRRRWKGRMVEVVVERDGFVHAGKTFPSLSAAATAIAGSRWNGPRFFGLRDGS